MKKTEARLYAESIQEQNREKMIDSLRELMHEDIEMFKLLHQLLHLDNTDAMRRLDRLPKPARNHLMQWIIPVARLGLTDATFAMEDKYTDPAEADDA